jgi:hypothetical protein
VYSLLTIDKVIKHSERVRWVRLIIHTQKWET